MPHFTGILFALAAVITSAAATTVPFNPLYDNENGSNLYGENYQEIGSAYGNSVQKTKNYYVQVLVFVDSELYSVFNKNKTKVQYYVKSFWKGVDRRFKALKTLKISLSIVDIIIQENRTDTPYLNKNIFNGNFFDVEKGLADMGKYIFKNETNLPQHDIAVQMTKLEPYRRINGKYRKIAGFAYTGGACVRNERLKKSNGVAIIADSGGYSGIITGAHEVGHLLGASHDGSPPQLYLKNSGGGINCKFEDGYIMSDIRYTTNVFYWSSCSEKSIAYFLQMANAKCLLDVPHNNSFAEIPLPGKTMSLDDQCLRDFGTNSFHNKSSILMCTQLHCLNEPESPAITFRPAAEGSPCADDWHCISGVCVPPWQE